jgi:CheY-like chemotaxis protein
MTDSRPTLLLLDSPLLDQRVITDTLQQAFRVITSDADDPFSGADAGGYDAVLAGADRLRPLERQLQARQSTMLLDAIGEGVCLYREGGELIWNNAAFDGLDQAVKSKMSRAARHAFGYFEQRASAIAAGKAPPIKRYTLSFSRRRRYYEVRMWPVLQGDASVRNDSTDDTTPPHDPERSRSGDHCLVVRQIAAAVRDVSVRRRLQLKLESINRAGQELMHIDTQTVKQLHAAERLTMLEQRVIKYAKDLLHFDHFAVRMINPGTQSLDLVMSSGLPEEAKRVRLFVGRESNGISGLVAATGQSVISNDVENDPRYVKGLESAGSSLTVPLKLFDQVIGIFNVESHEKDSFNDADRQFAEMFASYLAMALHILNLLLVEKWTTNRESADHVQLELAAPLDDLTKEAQLLLDQSDPDSSQASHLRRILTDVDAIRRRVKAAQRGTRSLLGVQEAIERGKEDADLVGRRILVVDNEPEIGQMVRDVLQSRGCEVVVCYSGEEGAKCVMDAADVSKEGTLLLGTGPFDLVLTDINLGDLTGYDVFAAAKRASADTPVILMTGFGYDPHHSIVRASQEGLQCVLYKPFMAERLIEEVKKAVLL